MTSVLAIVGGGTTFVCVAVIAYLVYRLIDGLSSERASFAAEVMATREQLAAEVQRDAFKAQAMARASETVAALKQLEVSQAALKRAREELVSRVGKEILAGSPSDVDRIVDDLLSTPILPTNDPAATSGGDHGAAVAPAVQPADVAGPDQVRRVS